jgi:competence protein ComEC
MADWLLTFAAYCAHWLLLILEYFSALQPINFSSTRVTGLASTILAMLGATVFMLPRGTPGRFAGLLLMLPLLLPASEALEKNETRIDFLDVGQGLSVLLSTGEYLMVYDSGPGNGLDGENALDMVAGTIQPMIRATGKAPDLVVTSHGDLDHAGGLERLRSEYPDARYIASLSEKRTGIEDCRAPLAWLADKLEFRILHPSTGLPYLGNDSSCVVSVTGPGLSLLLSGDISRAVEQRLVDEGLEQHFILTAPHHGSSTSSSQTLVEAVRPAWVLISTAEGNRFDFPRADVLERYAQAKATTMNTAICGGIRITSNTTGVLRMDSARVSRNAIWRWPAHQDC